MIEEVETDLQGYIDAASEPECEEERFDLSGNKIEKEEA